MLYPQCIIDNDLPQDLYPQGEYPYGPVPIWAGYRGSLAHRTHIPPEEPFGTDDKDAIGVFLAPRSFYIGIEPFKETIEYKQGDWDVVWYEFRHYIRLLMKQNPNVLCTLWPPEGTVFYQHPLFRAVLDERDAFVSKKAKAPFLGYARQQLHKMTSTPAPSEEREAEIGMMKREIAFRQHRFPKDPLYLFEELRHTSIQDMRTRVNVLKGQTGYMGEKRKRNVEEFGYDVKNAAHLVRLLKMGAEFFREGRIIVDREQAGDARMIKSIKTGCWSLENMKVLGDVFIEDLEAAHKYSKLPEEPNTGWINQLCMSVLSLYT